MRQSVLPNCLNSIFLRHFIFFPRLEIFFSRLKIFFPRLKMFAYDDSCLTDSFAEKRVVTSSSRPPCPSFHSLESKLSNRINSSSTSAIRSAMSSTEQLQETLKSVSELSLKPRVRVYGGSKTPTHNSPKKTNLSRLNRSSELWIDDTVVGARKSRLEESKSSGIESGSKPESRARSPRRDNFRRGSAVDISDSFEQKSLLISVNCDDAEQNEATSRSVSFRTFLFLLVTVGNISESELNSVAWKAIYWLSELSTKDTWRLSWRTKGHRRDL